MWFCLRQGPKSHPGQRPTSHPSQVQPTWGTSPLLLPPHLLGVSPAQLESPWCSLRSGLQPPARGQPSTHGGYWHPRGWCRMVLPASHTPKSQPCVLLHSSVPSSPGCLCLKSHSPPSSASQTRLPCREAELALHALAETGQRRSGD